MSRAATASKVMKVDAFHAPDYVFWELGKSVEGRKLQALAVGPHTDTSTTTAACVIPYAPERAGFPWVMFLGGLYGDEPEAVWLMRAAWESWAKGFEYRLIGTVVCDKLNPDAIEVSRHLNAHDVDLSLNLATKDWKLAAKKPGAGTAPASEPEARALGDMVEACRPCTLVMARTTDKPMILCDGPSRSIAMLLAPLCQLPIAAAPSVPGGLGTFTGKERGLPMITLGIPRGMAKEEVLKTFLPVLDAVLKYWESRL